jgi:transposase
LSKLTKHQRQELKSLVANATVRRLTSKETSAFVLEQLGVSITNDYVRRIRMDLKHDYAKELQSLQKDRDLYIKCMFWDRVHELEYQQRVLHEVIDNNKQSNLM